jgi:hypothetical protein
MMNHSGVYLLNFASTLYLVGLIWTVQAVHYKLFDRVGSDAFVRYETDHNQLITPIVGPVMLIELATSVLLVFGYSPPWMPRSVAIAGLVAVGMIWASTIFLQVPCHNRLLSGFDLATYQRLVSTNWIRTILWSARGAVLLYILWLAMNKQFDSNL